MNAEASHACLCACARVSLWPFLFLKDTPPPPSFPLPFCPPHTYTHTQSWQCWCDAALKASVYTLSILVASEPLRIATDSISREQNKSRPSRGSQTEREGGIRVDGGKEWERGTVKCSRGEQNKSLPQDFPTVWDSVAHCLHLSTTMPIILSFTAPYGLYLPVWV